MARKRMRDWPIVVYSYGVLPSFIRNRPKWIEDEAFYMNCLWNDLVEISRRYREAYRTSLDEDPCLKPLALKRNELQEQIEDLTRQIKKLRQKLRTRKHPQIDDLAAKRKELQAELREVRKEYSEKKREIREEYSEIWRRMEKEVEEKIKEYADRLFWADREVIRDRFWTAWWKAVKEGRELRFKSFGDRNSWTVTWRFQKGGLPVKDLVGRIVDRFPPEEAYSLPKRKRDKKVKVVATLGHKKPAERKVEVPFIMHRPMPEDGYVKRITLVRRTVGPDGFEKWFLNFTVEVPPEKYIEKPEGRKPLAVMEIGFRKMGEGETELKMPVDGGRKARVKVPTEYIRVGILYDGEKTEEIYLPEKVVAKVLASRKKQAAADRLLEDLKRDLWAFFREEDVIDLIKDRVGKEIPGLFANTTTWGRVRKRGLLKLALALEKAGVFEDVAGEIRAVLDEWTRMVSVAVRMRKKAFGYRDKFYENLAVRIFNEYETLVVPEIDLKRLSEGEQKDRLPDKARFQRFTAALHTLVILLERRAQKTGATVKKVEFPYKTRLCYACGTVNEPADPAKLEWVCEGCGKRWDQDVNAVMNLWKRIKSVG